jgi:hypothetical protein
MKHSSLWTTCLSLALVAGCPKKNAGTDVEPVPGPPPGGPPAGKIAAPHVNDPTIVCHDPDQGRTVYSVELGFPEGCGPLPTEPGGQASDLEITVENAPSTATIIEPVDLAARAVAYEREGCGARLVFTGGIGTLELEVAPAEYGGLDVGGSGHWTPSTGEGCDLTVTGTYSTYDQRD